MNKPDIAVKKKKLKSFEVSIFEIIKRQKIIQ